MYGDQRPVAPWADHNWWGQYDDPGQFPNVAGAVLQMNNEVQAGDMAWSEANTQVYVCLDGTLGAALWQPISMNTSFPANLDFYLAKDAANASDANPGTALKPWKTLDHAIAVINTLGEIPRGSSVMLHMATPTTGPYTYSGPFTPRIIGALVIYGDGAGQPGDDGLNELDTGVADAGSSTTKVVKTGGGMVVNAFRGYSVEILDGAAAGARRLITKNDATTLSISAPFPAAVAQNDNYRVISPAVEIETLAWDVLGPTVPQVEAFFADGGGAVNNFLANTTMHGPAKAHLWSIRFTTQDSLGQYINDLRFERTVVAMLGTEYTGARTTDFCSFVSDETSLVKMGNDALVAADLGVIASASLWEGWGHSSLLPDLTNEGAQIDFGPVARLSGYLVKAGLCRCDGSVWRLIGGALFSFSGFGTLDAQRDARCYLGGTNAATRLLLDNTLDSADVPVVRVRAGADVEISNHTTVTKTNRGFGVLVNVETNGQGALPGRCGIEGSAVSILGVTATGAPGYGMVCAGAGCTITFVNAPVMTGWPGGQQTAVMTDYSPIVVVQAADLAYYAAAGTALPAKATSDGRNGFIARGV